jgi:hypothetical protein
MSATTPDGLVSFRGYLVSGSGAKNVGQSPYTIKAADLDNNFQRVVCRDADKIQVVRSSDGKAAEAGPLLTFKRDSHGQVAQASHQTLDVVVDGVIRQMVVVGQIVPED